MDTAVQFNECEGIGRFSSVENTIQYLPAIATMQWLRQGEGRTDTPIKGLLYTWGTRAPFPSSELGPPFPASECVSPLGPKGGAEATLACG